MAFIADDYAFIAKRLDSLKGETPMAASDDWWCVTCSKTVALDTVNHNNPETGKGKCGHRVHLCTPPVVHTL